MTQAELDELYNLRQAIERMEKARRKCRCPYRLDLEILCFEYCGKGNASDCEIWIRHSGQLAQSIQDAHNAGDWGNPET